MSSSFSLDQDFYSVTAHGVVRDDARFDSNVHFYRHEAGPDNINTAFTYRHNVMVTEGKGQVLLTKSIMSVTTVSGP